VATFGKGSLERIAQSYIWFLFFRIYGSSGFRQFGLFLFHLKMLFPFKIAYEEARNHPILPMSGRKVCMLVSASRDCLTFYFADPFEGGIEG
jgi:hypothetical protein